MSHIHERTQDSRRKRAAQITQSAARDLFIQRFQVAHALLKAGVSPAQVRRLARGTLIERLFKYSPDQPRVPAGSGWTSGQWTNGATGQATGPAGDRQRPDSKPPSTGKPRRGGASGLRTAPQRSVAPAVARPGASSTPPTAASVASDAAAVVTVLGPRNPGIDIGSLSERALSGLTVFLRGLAVTPEALAGAAVGGFGLALIPTNDSLDRRIKVPGPGDVSVSYNLDELGLTFRYTTADGVQHEWKAAPAAGGVYLGPDGKVIARWTKVGGAAALVVSTAALLNDERPKLCPDTVPDNHGPNGVAYEEMMKRLFNPGNPTPKDMAYGYYGPDGNLVKIDDCQQQTGQPAEYKGPGYAAHLAKNDPVWWGQLKKMQDQAERQAKAVPDKTILWFFAERSVYEEMEKELSGYPNIRVLHVPMPGHRRRK